MFSLGRVPFTGLSNQEAADVVLRGDTPDVLTRPPDCPQPLYELIQSCLAFKAKDRPSFSSLRKQLEALLEDRPSPAVRGGSTDDHYDGIEGGSSANRSRSSTTKGGATNYSDMPLESDDGSPDYEMTPSSEPGNPSIYSRSPANLSRNASFFNERQQAKSNSGSSSDSEAGDDSSSEAAEVDEEGAYWLN
jgi:Protein tyrosine and serine/threonine kinase